MQQLCGRQCSQCIVQQACVISEYHNVRTRFRTEAHASWQEMQQEEPAKAWRSRKSLHKHGTGQEPRQAWRAKITLSIIGGLGNNISGETTTNHNHLERIDTADETVSQYKAYDAIHLSENADEQKPDNEPTRNLGAVCMTVHISTYHQQFKILIIYKRRHMTNEICTHILHIIHNTHAT